MDLERPKEQRRGRRTFEKDFKLGAVKLILEGGKTVREVSEDLGVSQNTLLHWKKNYLKDKQNSFPGKGHQLTQDEELTRLKKENDLLKEERDILKKAAAYFARYQK